MDRSSPHRLKDAYSPTASQEITSNELAQRLDNLPIVAAPADVTAENASVENRWCQLRDMVQSTALAVLGPARRQHQEWFATTTPSLATCSPSRTAYTKPT
ncbi:hypothetical protein SprV_0200708800 [Sparganum proliferum]